MLPLPVTLVTMTEMAEEHVHVLIPLLFYFLNVVDVNMVLRTSNRTAGDKQSNFI
jgi:hypothetical protein